MIKVPWVIDELVDDPVASKHEAIGKFFYTLGREPWAEFLFEHATKIETRSYYDPVTVLHNVTIIFHLLPEEETMYRLRFS